MLKKRGGRVRASIKLKLKCTLTSKLKWTPGERKRLRRKQVWGGGFSPLQKEGRVEGERRWCSKEFIQSQRTVIPKDTKF